MSAYNLLAVPVTITVAGGAGSATWIGAGTLLSINFTAPDQAAVFDWEVIDGLGNGVAGKTGDGPGNITRKVDMPCKGVNAAKNTTAIANSTKNGVFTATMYVLQAIVSAL